MAKSKHVVKQGNGWAVKSGGRTISSHRTQANARKSAISVAKQQGAEVVVHGRNGQFREKSSYGNDPHPPKG